MRIRGGLGNFVVSLGFWRLEDTELSYDGSVQVIQSSLISSFSLGLKIYYHGCPVLFFHHRGVNLCAGYCQPKNRSFSWIWHLRAFDIPMSPAGQVY